MNFLSGFCSGDLASGQSPFRRASCHAERLGTMEEGLAAATSSSLFGVFARAALLFPWLPLKSSEVFRVSARFSFAGFILSFTFK